MNDDNMSEVTAVYFAKKVLRPVYENTEEAIIAKKGEDKKTIKARFISEQKIKKEDLLDYDPETPFDTVKGGEKIVMTFKKKVRDAVSFKRISKAKIKEKVWIVATCNGTTGKLSVEINENKLANTEAVYDSPVKFLIGEEENTKIEFEIFKDLTVTPNTYAKEITLQPKSNEDVKTLLDKFGKRTDKNAFLYFKAETIDPNHKIIIFEKNNEFINNDEERLEILGSPCYCGVDFTVEEIRMIVQKIRDNTFYYDDKTEKNYSITHYHNDKLFHLESSLPNSEKNNYGKLTEVLNKMFQEFKINTYIRKINFLAQMYPETMFFTDLSENTPSSDLGIYYGRGFIQLTHKGDEDSRTKNATSYLGYKKYSNLDVITKPNLICESLENAANSAGWFWRFGKRLNDGSIKDLNTLADIDDADEISRLVNGGNNARKERLEANKQLKKIFIYEDCINKK